MQNEIIHRSVTDLKSNSKIKNLLELAYREMAKEQINLHESLFKKNSCKIISYFSSGKPIGIILYDTDYDNKKRNQVGFIHLAYVSPVFRRKKIYKKMHEFLVATLKKSNILSLASEVHKGNHIFLACLESVGLKLLYFRTLKELQTSSKIDEHFNNFTLKKSNNLIPVYPFFLRHMAELIEQGFSPPGITWNDNFCEAIYLESNNHIIGSIIYSTEFIEEKKFLYIQLSATDQKYRNQGIYKFLHLHFENIALEKNCRYVSGLMHKNNSIRIKSCKSVGLDPLFHFVGCKI